MIVERLELPAFKNLRSFAIDFDRDAQTTMLVGRNSTGKSNLIEALVRIFRDLIQHRSGSAVATDFAYRLRYGIRNHSVEIDHDPRRDSGKTKAKLDGAAISLRALRPVGEQDYLPQTVFAYYSGPSNRLESTFDEPLAEFRDAMIKGVTDTRQRLIYGRLIHSKFVLLSFFADPDSEAVALLDDELGIEALESVLFVVRQPYWGRRQQPSEKNRFWGARGVVQEKFLSRLYNEALAPLQLDRRVTAGIRRQQTIQEVYLFFPDRSALTRLVDKIGDLGSQGPARELFKVLESAYVSDLIEDVRVNVRKRNLAGHITFRELSEGEQQLLMVLGLLRFTRDEDSLFLLDEPDTHLNPIWSLRYTELIQSALGGDGAGKNSQLIVATHDPVAVAMLRKHQVRQFVRADDGQIAVQEPDEDPMKLGIAGVLLSELYGFSSLMAPEIAEKIHVKHRLIAKADKRTPAEDDDLERLRRELMEIDLSAMHPDPLYARFLKRLFQRERDDLLSKPALSTDELRELEKLTDDVFEELELGDERPA